MREDLGEEFVRERAKGGGCLVLGGVEWSGDAHAGLVDLPRREGWAERRKYVVAGSIHARLPRWGKRAYL